MLLPYHHHANAHATRSMAAAAGRQEKGLRIVMAGEAATVAEPAASVNAGRPARGAQSGFLLDPQAVGPPIMNQQPAFTSPRVYPGHQSFP